MNSIENRLASIVNKYNMDKNSLLDILEEVKKEFININTETIEHISNLLDIPTAKIEGVITFYSFLGDKPSGKYVIRLCKTISCDLNNKKDILEFIESETKTSLNQTSEDGMFTIRECNCLGMCDQGPALLINNVLISRLEEVDIRQIISACKNGSFNNSYGHRYVSQIHKKDSIFSFLENNETKFHDYINSEPEEIIEKITAAGLRGRGGAGFPTGLKWLKAAKIESSEKYIICNADEGEPGTFKDRFLLDNYPSRVIEGMITGARAIGAGKGIIYLRGEYEYLKDKILENIKKYNFDISVHIGAGSYICGEETALIESLEGKRGEARNRPPYPVEVGYLGKPTVVNNVETFVDVCMIMEKGEEYFRSYGTSSSNGTKFFSISGDCPNPGIYEIPFGVSIKDLIIEIGAKDVKSVQLGGASGRNIGHRDFEKIIAFEAVPSGGSIIIFNSNRNMLKVARNFMDFFVDESCGQCVPCRKGTKKILEGIDQILEGNGSIKFLESLVKLGNSIMISSKCGLGQVCSVAFSSIVNNHKNEIIKQIEG